MTVIAAPVRLQPGVAAPGRERMVRSLHALKQRVHDVLVVGGGIYGAWVARDAAQRGLAVALIEQDDFGAGTSSNSHKIIHGGLRYLQHGDVRRMRESIRERRTLLRIAPHLVSPMPVLVPAYEGAWPGEIALHAAMLINDLLSLDRNRGVAPSHAIGRGRIVSRTRCIEAVPGLPVGGLRGGALFFDAQVRNPERLLLSVLWAAVRDGAIVSNSVRAAGFVREAHGSRRIRGVVAEDRITGERFPIRAELTINCTGPWLAETLRLTDVPEAHSLARRFRIFEAIVLVTCRLTNGVAVSIPRRSRHLDEHETFRKGYRNFFITPWRGASLVGTFYRPVRAGGPMGGIDEFLDEFNGSWPGARLSRDDVRHVCIGRLPLDPAAKSEADLQYSKRATIVDHAVEHDLGGMISVCGVKWTTARLVAERAVNLAMRRLGRPRVKCGTEKNSLDAPEDDQSQWLASRVGEEIARHLSATYGSSAARVLQYADSAEDALRPLSESTTVTRAEVMHGVDAEMAQNLADIVFRRTELATAGHPGGAALEACARTIAPLLRWDGPRIRREIDCVEEVFARIGGRHEAS